jgi:hypothetical protein
MDFSAFPAAHFGASQCATFQRLVNPGNLAGSAHLSSMETTGYSEAYDGAPLPGTDHTIAAGQEIVEGNDVVASDYYVDPLSDQNNQDILEQPRLLLTPAVIEMFARSAAYREECTLSLYDIIATNIIILLYGSASREGTRSG